MPTFSYLCGGESQLSRGGPGRPVVLIHGYTAPGAAWALTTDALVAADYRVIAFDRCSHGESETQRRGDLGVGEALDQVAPSRLPR